MKNYKVVQIKVDIKPKDQTLKNKMLKNVDPIVWHKLKVLSTFYKLSMAEMIGRLIENYTNNHQGENNEKSN